MKSTTTTTKARTRHSGFGTRFFELQSPTTSGLHTAKDLESVSPVNPSGLRPIVRGAPWWLIRENGH
jgi:hypothetical protein